MTTDGALTPMAGFQRSDAGGRWDPGATAGEAPGQLGPHPLPPQPHLPGKMSGIVSQLLRLGWLVLAGGPHGIWPQQCPLSSQAVFLSSCQCVSLLKCVSSRIAGSPSGGFVGVRKGNPALGRHRRQKHPLGTKSYTFPRPLVQDPANGPQTEFQMDSTLNHIPSSRCPWQGWGREAQPETVYPAVLSPSSDPRDCLSPL